MSTTEFEKSRLRMHRFEEGGVTVQVQWHGNPPSGFVHHCTDPSEARNHLWEEKSCARVSFYPRPWHWPRAPPLMPPRFQTARSRSAS
ncbi:hypothetical protein AGR4A_Lc40861 [Agrobacterium tumefaciens str. B6]|uniref:Uncharacterized protein n=1 Tax=Agrobacterium tumefaciens str. B6 TaxID=1183423 RepID=A0A822V6H8_AGRTU|nr:hypothetical protein AGR4A_Lc40861 [Agrobacterium tumefaciens str. B6]